MKNVQLGLEKELDSLRAQLSAALAANQVR